jgi:two-component system phosphate regulon sensor histidine kinase PhoR
LDEILFNILDNAAKYNRENGKILVEVKPRMTSVILSVTDTGIGISRSQQSRVFERFYRVDSSRTGRQNGTGLGLSIVKNAVQILGGKVSIASVEGEWTRISVKLPLSQQSGL